MAARMGSPGHRANILQRAYREIGFGVIAGNPSSRSGGGATYVTEFGVVARPLRSRPPGPSDAAPSTPFLRQRAPAPLLAAVLALALVPARAPAALAPPAGPAPPAAPAPRLAARRRLAPRPRRQRPAVSG